VKILFIDDSPYRHIDFTKLIPDADMVFNYKQAINALCHTMYDIIFLDHDLSEEDIGCLPGVTNKDKTGTDIVNFMVQNNIKPTEAVVIHSFNPIGSDRMERILQDVGIKVLKLFLDLITLIVSP